MVLYQKIVKMNLNDLDNFDKVLAFSLAFSPYISSSAFSHSPDYILEKFNQCFTVPPDKFKPIVNNSVAAIDYIKTWGLGDMNPYNIINIINWLERPYRETSNDSSYICLITRIYNEFNSQICEFTDVTFSDNFMTLHTNSKEAILDILEGWAGLSSYKIFKRTHTINLILNS
jgi:hypothetical protein